MIIIQNEYFQFLLIIVGFIILAKVLHLILTRYVRRLAEKTKSDIDDIILGIVTKPLYILIILIGLYMGLKSLSILTPYLFWIKGVFFVIFALIISVVVSKILSVFISQGLKVQKRFEKTPQLIIKIVNIAIYLIAILVILKHFNIEITPLVATLGLGGLAIGLALQSTLSNLFAGLHIISDKPVNVGDFIVLGDGISGYVEDIGWRSTRIRTLPNNIVVIPNSKLADSIITNRSMPQQEMGVVVQCGVAYTSDLEKVERVTVDVAREIQRRVPGAVKTFQPFIRYHTFGDSNINFSIILRVKDPVSKYLVVHEFIKALKKRYDEEGIEISWPVVKLYRGDKG